MTKQTNHLLQATVNLGDITPSPLNPRKDFDEESINDLAASIKEKGVLQPILVRPLPGKDPNKFELVCGERRYRASLLLLKQDPERTTIPVNIRTLTDDEVLELQIIENLQRQNVHPMEEAAAFQGLIKIKQYQVTEIAKRVGKSPRYVSERLKLNSLIPEFQKAFYQNKMTLETALRVTKLQADDQKDLYNEEKNQARIEVNMYQLNSYLGDLNTAAFNIEDPELDKKAGACITCPFNTASNTLFPEEAQNPKCGNSKCFKSKTEKSFQLELEKALQDPTIELVSNDYHVGKVASELRKKGHKVLAKHTDFNIPYNLRKPEPIESWEEYKENELDGFDSEEACRKSYEREIKSYQQDLKEYDKTLNSGKYVKAFVVEGDNTGKYVFIEIGKKKVTAGLTSSTVKAKLSEGTAAKEDLQFEIKRIQDNEKRKKELDQEKINTSLYVLLNNDKSYYQDGLSLSKPEAVALIIALATALNYQGKKKAERLLNSSNLEGTALYKKLSEANPAHLNEIINKLSRMLIVQQLQVGLNYDNGNNGKSLALEGIMMTRKKELAQKILDESKEQAWARAERVAARIEGLKKKQKALAKAAKDPAPDKKPAAGRGKKKGLSALLEAQEA